jgi:hypothetical protein
LRLRRIVIIIVAFAGFGCFTLLGGCADETKTTGTQLEFSPEVKAQIDDMRGAMKGHRKQVIKEDIEAKRKGR